MTFLKHMPRFVGAHTLTQYSSEDTSMLSFSTHGRSRVRQAYRLSPGILLRARHCSLCSSQCASTPLGVVHIPNDIVPSYHNTYLYIVGTSILGFPSASRRLSVPLVSYSSSSRPSACSSNIFRSTFSSIILLSDLNTDAAAPVW